MYEEPITNGLRENVYYVGKCALEFCWSKKKFWEEILEENFEKLWNFVSTSAASECLFP